jgi:hypothetical protein
MVHDPQSWDALDGNEQLLLAEQAPPYGAAFATLERVLHDEGPQARSVLLDALRRLELPGAADLSERVAALVAPFDDVDLRGQARIVLDRLRLKAIEDELEAMFDSGTLSEDARRRSALLAQQRALLKAQLGSGAPAQPGV